MDVAMDNDDSFVDNYEMEESDMSEKEKEESVISDKKDRLSELPSSLILHILSFLPMKDVVSTTILSKRWKNLWNTVPCLNFCDYIAVENDADRIRNFVNRALMFWKGDKIQTFTLDFDGDFVMSLAEDIDLWVLYAKEYKVEELNIHLAYDLSLLDWNREKNMYRAPHCLNSCSSLEKLSLIGCNLRIPESPPLWNHLKSLNIDGFRLSEHLINQILSGSPQLEILKLRLLESNENLNIQSRSLKKLRIEKYVYFDYSDRPSRVTKLRIWSPNLDSLELCGVLYSEYLLTNVLSVTNATLGFPCRYHYDYGTSEAEELFEEASRQILSTIRHVEKVTLSDWCVEAVIPMWKRCSLSPLSNVKILKLDVNFCDLDKVLIVNILRVFPKVKTLIIDNAVCPASYDYEPKHAIVPQALDAEHTIRNLPNSLMLHNLESIEIISCLCETSVFPFIELLLKHASVLQKMVIRARGIMSFPLESFFLVSEKLLSMSRSSPSAKVILCKK